MHAISILYSVPPHPTFIYKVLPAQPIHSARNVGIALTTLTIYFELPTLTFHVTNQTIERDLFLFTFRPIPVLPIPLASFINRLVGTARDTFSFRTGSTKQAHQRGNLVKVGKLRNESGVSVSHQLVN